MVGDFGGLLKAQTSFHGSPFRQREISLLPANVVPSLLLSTTDVVFALVFRTLPDSKSKGNFPLIIIVIIKETSAHQKSRYADLCGRYFDIKADSKT